MSRYEILEGVREVAVYDGEKMIAVFYGETDSEALGRATRFVTREKYLEEMSEQLHSLAK